MSWYAELDQEFDEVVSLRNKILGLELEYHKLAATNADNIRKAHYVFNCLRHIEIMAEKCPTCGAERDEDGILAHHRECYLADTLENANQEENQT